MKFMEPAIAKAGIIFQAIIALSSFRFIGALGNCLTAADEALSTAS
jgi:hypothetical protein